MAPAAARRTSTALSHSIILQDMHRKGATEMKRVYTAAVVGGGAGGSLSMAALAASERFELVALADISPAARAAASERYPGIQTFADHRQMLASTPVDVVCVQRGHVAAVASRSNDRCVGTAAARDPGGKTARRHRGERAPGAGNDQGQAAADGRSPRPVGRRPQQAGAGTGTQRRHRRAEAGGNSVLGLGHHQRRYPLAGLLCHANAAGTGCVCHGRMRCRHTHVSRWDAG